VTKGEFPDLLVNSSVS